MSKLIIQGPSKLKGSVKVGGSKNASLPIIAATLLARGKFELSNVPDITDVHNLVNIIEGIGGITEFKDNTLYVDTSQVNGIEPDKTLVRRIRASILLVGPLLARNGEVTISMPGGCFIGNRPLDAHMDALSSFGTRLEESHGNLHINAPSGLTGAEITLKEMSVTACENTIMVATLAHGKTVIKLAPIEPHVQDLCHFLNKMGANITGIGTHELTIKGVEKLNAVKYSIIYDEIEAGTYMVAAAATNGEIEVLVDPKDIQYSIISKLREANVELEIKKDRILIKKSFNIKPIKLWSAPSPHFPSDLQAPFSVLMTRANGTSLIHETMYEGRLNHLKELKKMGANVSVLDPHRAAVMGPTQLFGKKINTLDLRAGATLIIAALVAEGESIISHAEIIDRGYEDIVKKFQGLGAKIKRIE